MVLAPNPAALALRPSLDPLSLQLRMAELVAQPFRHQPPATLFPVLLTAKFPLGLALAFLTTPPVLPPPACTPTARPRSSPNPSTVCSKRTSTARRLATAASSYATAPSSAPFATTTLLATRRPSSTAKCFLQLLCK